MASRWGTVQKLIAEKLITDLGDSVEDVITAPTRALAQRSVRVFPTVAVLLPTFSGLQPDTQLAHISVQGSVRIEVLAFVADESDNLDPEEASELLDAVSTSLVGYAPQPYTDESPWQIWKESQGFEDHEGGMVLAVAAFGMEVVETHTEG